MQRESEEAVVRRLSFVAAELEVVGEIAKQEDDLALLEQVNGLRARIKDCISRVSKGKEGVGPSLPSA